MQGLHSSVLRAAEQVGRHVASTDPDDVFVIVKQWMADESLNQPAVLACPRALRRTVITQFKILNQGAHLDSLNMDEKRSEGLLKLARFLERTYSIYSSAVAYLRSLANREAGSRQKAPELEFLTSGQGVAVRRPQLEIPSEEVLVPRRLRARFRRPVDAPQVD